MRGLSYLRKWWEETKWTDKTIAVFTVVIAGAAILQWCEMRDAGRQTDRIIAADERLATAMEKSVAAAGKALDATIAENQLDQRAWIIVRGIQGRPTLNRPLEFTVFFLNTGRTPAKEVRWSCNFEVRRSERDVTFKEAPYGEAGLMAPNDPNAFCSAEQRGPKTNITQPDLDSLRSGQLTVFIFGSAIYNDVFARSHWLTFCRHLRPDGVSLETCAGHADDTGDGRYDKQK
jgi:hypothetical protein